MIGSSSKNGGSTLPTLTPKAMEAELIQKATQTAIVAARSILMSGGTEESALKTAKAAAESVLNPAVSESGTVGSSSIGNAFGGKKRKAKRQAEVVASMALMSATSLLPNGGSLMDEANSVNKMHGQHIVTVKQDEPSVLTGATPHLPKTPKTPGSQRSRFSFQTLPQVKEEREAPPEQNNLHFTHPPLSPRPPQNSQNVLSPNHTLRSAFRSFLSKDDDDTTSNHFAFSTSVDSERYESSTLYEDTDDDTSAFFWEMKKKGRRSRFMGGSKSEDESEWNLETLIKQIEGFDFSASLKKWNLNLDKLNLDKLNLDMMKCGEGVLPFEGSRFAFRRRDKNRSVRGSVRSRASHSRRTCSVESRDDTFEDETTAFSPVSAEKKEMYKDSDFPNSYDSDSCHSDILSTDFSEGELNVRSSIRNTMETMVSKSAFANKVSIGKSKARDQGPLDVNSPIQPQRSRSFFRKKR